MGSTATSDSTSQLTPFGRPMLKHFLFDPNYKNLNHGSFGTIPRAVRIKQRELQDEAESKPDVFIRYSQVEYLNEARKEVAKILNIPVNETVFVKNATTGINTVLRNLKYEKGDVIIYFATIYNALEKLMSSLIETTPVQARKVEYVLPISHEEIVKRFVQVVRQAKSEGLNVKIALFDAIVSQPGVRFPFEKLIEACREEGVLSCVDGAHGVGHIPLDLGALKPDFFVSNCHKWLYAPRACAVFHVPVRNQHLMRTTFPTSHGFQPVVTPDGKPINNPLPQGGKSPFEQLFEFVATTDDTPYLCVPTAVKFRKEVCGGEEKITAHCEKLAFEASNAMADILGTEVMCEPGVDPRVLGASALRRCALATIRAPIAVGSTAASAGNAVVSAAEAAPLCRWIEKELMYKHNTVVPHFQHGDWVWFRISAQTYLELDDFVWVAHILKGIYEQIRLAESVSSLLL